jgi:uncharacterized protein YbjT (DUF2867 family)
VILVTGATGNVGRNVVAQLLAEGAKVCAASRSPETASLPDGVEVVRADLAAPGTPPATFRGIDRIFLFPANGPLAGFVAAAAGAGVDRVVLLSSAAVVNDHMKDTPIGAVHMAAEQAVTDAVPNWTFVRPGAFMANDLRWAPGIKSGGVVRAPFGAGTSAPIDERDIAAVVVRALLDEGHAGAAYELTGPESLTQIERAGILGEVLGHPVRFEEQDVEQARQQFRRQLPPAIADTVLDILARTVPGPAELSSAGREVLGRPLHTYRQWAQHHVADFR